MSPQPDPVDPVDVAYERIFLELPTQGWRRYDFRAMSHAERTAAAMLVKVGAAELRLQCSVKIPGSEHELRAIAVVSGAYMDTSGAAIAQGRIVVCWALPARLGRFFHRDSHAHKSALRLTVEGERTREQHRAGFPAPCGTPHPVPGQVHLEKIEVAPPVESSMAAQPAALAAAIASVGDINVTVNVPSPEVVVLASTDVPTTPRTPRLKCEDRSLRSSTGGNWPLVSTAIGDIGRRRLLPRRARRSRRQTRTSWNSLGNGGRPC